MNEFFTLLLQGGATGGGFAGVFLFFRWLANFIAGRVDKRDERLDGKEARLVERLEKQVEQLLERLDKVEHDLEECKQRHAEERAERLKFERLLQAQGDVANQVQTLVAAERVDSKKAS